MGGKNSGRYKKGIKKSDLKKNEKNQVVTKTEVKTPEPKIESTEENFDFEANANRILNASNASIEAQKATKKESAPEEKKEETTTEVVKQKEDWTPVAAMAMQILGGVFQSTTGFKEMNYTEDEIEKCAPAVSDLLNVFFPDVKALTEEQKIILINSAILLKVHVDKVTLLVELKKQKAAKLDEPTDVKAEPTAA